MLFPGGVNPAGEHQNRDKYPRSRKSQERNRTTQCLTHLGSASRGCIAAKATSLG